MVVERREGERREESKGDSYLETGSVGVGGNGATNGLIDEPTEGRKSPASGLRVGAGAGGLEGVRL